MPFLPALRGAGLQFLGGAVAQQSPLVQDQEPARQRGHVREHVAAEQDRAILPQTLEEAAEGHHLLFRAPKVPTISAEKYSSAPASNGSVPKLHGHT